MFAHVGLARVAFVVTRATGRQFVVVVQSGREIGHSPVDVDFAETTSEAFRVADMPFVESAVLDIRSNSAHVHRVGDLQVFPVPFVNDSLWHTSINDHGEVLASDQHLQSVEFPIIDLFITEHGRHWVVSNIEADPDAPSENLHGSMLVVTVVQDNALSLSCGQDDC